MDRLDHKRNIDVPKDLFDNDFDVFYALKGNPILAHMTEAFLDFLPLLDRGARARRTARSEWRREWRVTAGTDTCEMG